MTQWFRWHVGTAEDAKFRVIARNATITDADGTVTLPVTVRDVIAVWTFILEDASHDAHRGVCTRDHRFITAILDFQGPDVDRILQEMEALGMIVERPEGIEVLNWSKRQYETDHKDPTNGQRQRRWRENQKTARNGRVTPRKHTETETEAETERKKDAAGAAPELPLPIDRPPPTLRVVEERIDEPEKALFERGKQVLGQNAGGMIRKLLNARGGKIPLARAAIEQASTKQDPREYIARAIIGPANEVDAREEARLIEDWKTKHKRAVVFDTDRPAAIAEMLADRARAAQ